MNWKTRNALAWLGAGVLCLAFVWANGWALLSTELRGEWSSFALPVLILWGAPILHALIYKRHNYPRWMVRLTLGVFIAANLAVVLGAFSVI